ncbi:MAG TPA: class IV adenylate cyclase [Candidatus Polarisedimenticolaceae bacterium]
MSASRETEVKLPFESTRAAREALSRAGARLEVARSFEDNRIYDRGDGSLERDGLVLRLRVDDGGGRITFKGPVEGERRHKARVEHETVVGDPDAAHRLLEGLGYRVAWRYQKYRTTYRLHDVEAMLDETPIGCWVELEGEPDAIDRAAARLGIPPDRYVTDTYRDLAVRHARERGIALADLVFESAAP